MGAIAFTRFHEVKPIKLPLKNGAYGCENTMWKPGTNSTTTWRPFAIAYPRVFGYRGCVGRSISTIGSLEDAISTIENNPKLADHIKAMIPASASENVQLS